MKARPSRELEDRSAVNRALDLFDIWSVVAQAGIISRTRLGQILRSDPVIRERYLLDADPDRIKRFNVRLFRDLKVLVGELAPDRDETDDDPEPDMDPDPRLGGAGLLVSHRDLKGREWFYLGSALPGIFLGLRQEQGRKTRRSTGSRIPEECFCCPEIVPPEILAQTAVQDAPLPAPIRRSMGAFLAEAIHAVDDAAPAFEWLQRLERLYRIRFGVAPRKDQFVNRHLVPSFGKSREHLRRNLDHDSWNGILEALEFGFRLNLKVQGEAATVNLSPRRLVRYNGRFRLEGIRRYGGKRLQLIPLYRVQKVTVLSERVDPSDFPSAEETAALDLTWGLDASERLNREAEPHKQRFQRIVLLFSGQAISTIEHDPGHPEAQLTRLRVKGRRALRYEVNTIVGPFLKSWIRMWGPEVEVLEPASLRGELRDEALALAERYREEPHDKR